MTSGYRTDSRETRFGRDGAPGTWRSQASEPIRGQPKSENRGRLRRQPLAGQGDLTIRFKAPTGRQETTAKVIDISGSGIGLELGQQLQVGQLLELEGFLKSALGQQAISRAARVRWCSPAQNGRYRAGLSYEEASRDGGSHAAFLDSEEDHYEVLQLSPNADSETIQRVFRILAQRYHPDNQETGNGDIFRKIRVSYDVLIDPDMRSGYDLRRNAHRQDRLRIFKNWQSCTGMEAEKRKRQGILALLYAQRVSNPHQPGIGIRELEDLLACPREHLEFSLWFLKERKYVTRSDNNLHAITCEGVEAVEREGLTAPESTRPRLAAPLEPHTM